MRKHCSKVVIEKFFEPCALFLLMKKSAYGYELLKELESKCCCSVNVGNLYRSLSQFKKEGYITKKQSPGSGGPERVMYSITARGKKHLGEWIEELEEQRKTIGKLITNYKKMKHVASE